MSGGGCGDDTVGVWTDSLQVLFDNRITIGRGTDTVVLELTYASEGFNFDFSGAYDGRLTSGTRLMGFEAAEVYGGTGDDTFQGGRGNDTFYGGEGDDLVILDGARCYYQVTRLDEGGMQITDLRQGSPGGTDLYNNVETFVFDNGSFDLT
jgi:Ca2+-binding RTX toxin-like protein